MGGWNSTEDNVSYNNTSKFDLPNPKPVPPSPLFCTPWRKVPWSEKQDELTYVMNYKPKGDTKHLRIMLYGPVGAGKSSFINSVSTTMKGRIALPAAASAKVSEDSYTRKYTTHTIKKRDDSICPFIFTDIMGLEIGEDQGIRVEDIKHAMMGHLKDNYKFHATSSLAKGDHGHNPNPTPDDECHILVCVISANFAQVKPQVIEKMKLIRETARDLGIPQVCMATKIDETCPEIEKDLKKVYHSKYLKKKITEISSAVGFPLNCIFPVKNYHIETDLNDDVDSLILNALRKILDFGDDALKEE